MEKFAAVISSACNREGRRHTVRMTSDNWEAWMAARAQADMLATFGAKDVRVDYFEGSHWVAWSRAHRSMDAITECDQELVVLPYA